MVNDVGKTAIEKKYLMCKYLIGKYLVNHVRKYPNDLGKYL